MRKGSLLKLAVGLGKSHHAFGVTVAQMPDHPATDDGGQIDARSETLAMLCIGEDRGGPRQGTPGEHGDQARLAQGTNQAIEGHRRDVADRRAQLSTETAMRGHQGIAGHLGAHLAIAQDAVGQDGAHGSARGAREPPDGEPTQPDTGLMGVACKTPATAPSGLVFELKAEGEEKSAHEFYKGLAIAKQLSVRRVVSKIDRDGAVFAGLFGCCAHVSPPGH